MTVIYADARAAVVDSLSASLPSKGYPTAYVSAKFSGAKPFEVWVDSDGGPGLDVVREFARIRVNVYAKTGDVDLFARTVSALVRAAANGKPIVRVRQSSGPTEIPDTFPRRLMTFEVVTRGTNL